MKFKTSQGMLSLKELIWKCEFRDFKSYKYEEIYFYGYESYFITVSISKKSGLRLLRLTTDLGIEIYRFTGDLAKELDKMIRKNYPEVLL